MKTLKQLFLLMLGLMLAIKDFINISSIIKSIKHFFLVQSWWRLTLILITAAVIGYGWNLGGACLMVISTALVLLSKQEKYARENKTWDSIDGNEHFIIPIIITLSIIFGLQVFFMKQSPSKYEIIKEITLTSQNVTNNSDFYLEVNGMSKKIKNGKTLFL